MSTNDYADADKALLDSVPRDIIVTLAPAQSGTGDPSPDHIRPITGTSSVTVTRTGKNLLKMTAASQTLNGVTFTVNSDGSIICSGTATSYILLIIGRQNNLTKGERYIFTGCPSGGSANTYRVEIAAPWWMSETGRGLTFTSIGPTSGGDGEIRLIINSGVNVDGLVFKPMIRLATESDDAYVPYSAVTVTISFVDSNGDPLTVYGGTLDVTNGLLTVTHGYIASYNGETLPGAWISDRDVYAAGSTPTSGAQVVYELAAPVTYQLATTGLTAVASDNVSASTGSVSLGLAAHTPSPACPTRRPGRKPRK